MSINTHPLPGSSSQASLCPRTQGVAQKRPSVALTSRVLDRGVGGQGSGAFRGEKENDVYDTLSAGPGSLSVAHTSRSR